MSDHDKISLLKQHRDTLREWLVDNAPYAAADQRHLDENTPERAYWHHGYQSALNDIVDLLTISGQTTGSADIPS